MPQPPLPLFWDQMDWIPQTLLFGFLALALFLLSALALRRKKHPAGLTLRLLELLSAAISCSAWRWALWTSGKVDWSLLGLRSYPLMGCICVAMFAAGGLCVIGNTIGLFQTR
ncbi:MAG: hypothetical protein HFF06_05065 [Oscillospiraceae bacterium]|jgi:hypothetical protein|nr:hypothetical protein [Oscillospiraceae bacterium]